MYKAYQAVSKGTEIDKKWYSLCDSYGLTLLHYALILKNDTVAERILTILKSLKLPKHEESSDTYWMYDYALLACGMQSKVKDRVLLFFDVDVIALETEIAALKIKSTLNSATLNSINTAIKDCKSRIAHMERNDPFNWELNDLYEQKENLIDQYRSCSTQKQETEKALDELEKQRGSTYNDSTRNALIRLEELKKSKDPLAKLLFRLYFEPDFLYSMLSATSNQEKTKLYKCADIYLVAPDFAGLDPALAINISCDASDRNNVERPKLDGYAPITPPYGTSWFSASAHTDTTVLRAEYRALAKQYHPDVCKHPDSNTVMQKITAEYEQLLHQK